MKDPNYAPVYAALYPGLATIARKHGYALAVHGTMRRDFDLIAVPWTLNPSEPQAVLDDICQNFSINIVGDSETKLHGRTAWILSIGFGECAIDLSFIRICKI